ncbi:hypothetical protein [Neorhizobium sp. IRS_2294]|uniref:hypothetical protein n=1 Tax=unclassified Neorhizobium TaxID=2629175 RepID=UPI003D2AB305
MSDMQPVRDLTDLLLVETCFDLGFEEGLGAGRTEMKIVERDFAPHEGSLVIGHLMLDSIYFEVKRQIYDFPAKQNLDAWLEGFYRGVAQAGARVGFMSTIGDPDGSARLTMHLFVHRWPVPAEITLQ